MVVWLRKLRLTPRLIALFAVTAVIPILLISALSLLNARDSITTRISSQQDLYLALTHTRIDSFLSACETHAAAAARTHDLYQSMNLLARLGGNRLDPEWLERRDAVVETWGRSMVQLHEYSSVVVTDPIGRIVYAPDASIIGMNWSQRDYIDRPLQGHPTWSQLHDCEITEKRTVVFGQPIYSDGTTGDIVGSLALFVTDQELQALVRQGLHSLGPKTNAFLINEQGVPLTGASLDSRLRGPAPKVGLQTQAAQWAAEGIRAEALEFRRAGRYTDHLGHDVFGELAVVRLGGELAGLVIEIPAEEAVAAVYGFRNRLVVIVGIVILLGTALVVWLANTISRPASAIASVLQQAADGDLTVYAEVDSRDDISRLGDALNTMLNRLGIRLQRLSESAAHSAENADEAVSAVDKTSASLQNMAASTDDLRSSAEQASSESHAASQLVFQAKERTQQASGEIQNAVGNMEAIRRSVDDLSQEISGLDAQSQQIRSIVGMITTIAEQTNLLALNAAIEAARAGEDGRGFAVVADEVSKLAAQTGRAAGEIKTLIGEMDRVVGKTVSQSETSSELVAIGNQSIKTTGDSLSEIECIIDQLTQGVEGTAASHEKLASEAQQIVGSAEEQHTSVDELKIAVSRLAEDARELLELVRQFKL